MFKQYLVYNELHKLNDHDIYEKSLNDDAMNFI